MRCPRLPAVSIGKRRSRLNRYGLGMPGEISRVGFCRPPAVTMAALASSTRARAESSAGLKYKAASESVCKFQLLGGQDVNDLPKLCSTNDRRPASERVRDSSREAETAGTIGAGLYRCVAQPLSTSTAETTRNLFAIEIRIAHLHAKNAANRWDRQQRREFR